MAAPDLSLPLSTILRQCTAKAHDDIIQIPAVAWLTKGELDKDEYIRYLVMLWHVYHHLELGLERHASHPILAETYNPTLLSRAPLLVADIAFMLDVPESAWQTHPTVRDLVPSPATHTLPAPLETYVARLRTLAASTEGSPHAAPLLLAHAYVRYLGDLSGGQVLRRRIAKAYGLDAEDGSGIRFYEFARLGAAVASEPSASAVPSGALAGAGDMKKIKEWFRAGMDAAAGADREMKVAILQEALAAFDFNQALFSLIKPPSKTLGILPQSLSEEKKTLVVGPPQQRQPTADERQAALAAVVSLVVAAAAAHYVMLSGRRSTTPLGGGVSGARSGCFMRQVLDLARLA